MDLSNVLELAASRHPIFWAATAAIALGAACLTASVVLALRRLRRGTADRRAGFNTGPRRQPATAAPVAAALGDRYEPLQPVRAAAPAAAEGPSLALLLRRLQAAGDRLEDIAADLDLAVSFDPDSLLKDPLPDVEYVFKARGS